MSTLGQIFSRFPRIQGVEGLATVYDENQSGIAFEFPHSPNRGSRCVAVMIHRPDVYHYPTSDDIRTLLALGG